MNKILFINSCVRDESRTQRLARAVLSKLSGTVTETDLNTASIPLMDKVVLEKRNALIESGSYDDPMFQHAHAFASADIVVIAAPYWDLSFPALLKSYLEAVTVLGVTFRYSPEGIPVSLCRAKKLIYVTTAGGPIGEMNFGFAYVKALASTFFGIREFGFYSAENLDIYGVDAETVLRRAINEIKIEE